MRAFVSAFAAVLACAAVAGCGSGSDGAPKGFRISTTSLPDGFVGSAYSATLSAVGGVEPYRNWRLDSGALPDGLALDPDTGVVSGVPSLGGTFSFIVAVDDSRPPAGTARRALSITIHPSGGSTQTVTLDAVADAMIAEGDPATPSGAEEYIWCGYDDEYGFFDEYALVRFDVSSIPAGSTVLSAVLLLDRNDTYNKIGAGFVFEVAAVTSDWDEATVTWNAAPSFGGTAAVFFGGDDGETGPVSVSLPASLVQGWLSGGNHGLCVRRTFQPVSGECNELDLNSRESTIGNPPRLEVVYETP